MGPIAHRIYENGSHVSTSLQTYGVEVDEIKARFGATVDIAEVEKALQSKKYKIVTLTHVDTSSGSWAPLGQNMQVC